MRLVGILAFLLGAGGATYAVAAAFRARRPADLAWALAAPVAILVGIAGLVTLVSPTFLAP